MFYPRATACRDTQHTSGIKMLWGGGRQLGKKKSEKAFYETIIKKKIEKHCSRSGADKPCLQRAKTVSMSGW